MSFRYYKSITMAASQSGATDSTDWPLTICLDGNVQAADADLKTIANGGFVNSSSGYDIRPYSNATLTTALTFELVAYTASTGALEMHVKIPTLSHTVDTVIYLAFGDASVTTDGSSTSTWNSAYVGVYHMQDNAASTAVVNSIGSNNGTNAANTSTKTVTGQMKSALTYNGTSDQTTTPLARTLAFTWESWFKGTFSGGGGRYYNGLVIDGANYVLYCFNSNAGSFWTADALGGGNQGVTPINDNTWYHLVMVREGDSITNGYRWYLNGVQKTPANTGVLSAGNTMTIGNRPDQIFGQSFVGTIDEVRISNTNRSIDWILAGYNAQKTSSTFISWGTKISTNSNFLVMF